MVDLLEEALKWAKAGVPVFPCNTRKRPKTSHGFKNASTDPAAVMMMFSGCSYDDTLIGAQMGGAAGMVACDFDVYKPGEAGVSAKKFLSFLEESGALPDTQEHRTMSGGLHIIYRTSEPVPSSVPVLGVEIKGEGGYIILPPSKGYTIEREGIASAPPKLIQILSAHKRETKASTIDQLKADVLSGESFHEALTSIAAKRAAAGWSLERVMEELVGLMKASVASSSRHPRNDRWEAIMADSGKELTRIATSANTKYNTAAQTERAAEKLNDDLRERIRKTAEGIFGSPNEGNFEPPKPKEYTDDEWPFEGEGYFAHEQRNIVDQQFVMYPLFAERESVLIAAEPKAGKSAICLTFAFHIAIGENIGQAFQITRSRPVLYYSLEGQRATELRLEALKQWRAKKGKATPATVPLFVVEKSKNLVNAEAQTQSVNQVMAANRYCYKHYGEGLGVIFIDTLTKGMPGSDQNSVEDTSQLFEFVARLRDEGFLGTVVFVHHLSRAGHVRGSSNIEAEVDVIATVTKKKATDTVELYVARARSIDDGAVYTFKFENFSLGQNSQGHNMAAPVVHLTEYADPDGVGDVAVNALALNKFLRVVIELGLGRHDVLDLLGSLAEAGLIEAITSRRLRKVPDKVQAYIDNVLEGQISFVFKNFAVTKIMEQHHVVAVEIKKVV